MVMSAPGIARGAFVSFVRDRAWGVGGWPRVGGPFQEIKNSILKKNKKTTTNAATKDTQTPKQEKRNENKQEKAKKDNKTTKNRQKKHIPRNTQMHTTTCKKRI